MAKAMLTNPETVAKSTKRGDTVARGGNAGLFVGVDKSKIVWILADVVKIAEDPVD